ncbi:uncharacterized protein LOC128241789 isoform X1 [Mya arenaria]|uniref:uncharacterized protein LOC128241789 isoform X1 n=1 Tax=Mya arenaria TaxID=6604 RepID=UPI0022E453FA|nr:uncharacterized protein LOC128241789 isoform X1 [Mya arenaria]
MFSLTILKTYFVILYLYINTCSLLLRERRTLMVDPDAPNHSLESLTFYLHWAITDITGENLKRGLVQGTTLIGYHGPNTPFGIHRYQLVVFESTTGVHLTDQHRGHFSLLNFVNVNSASLCSVVAVFQFRVPP